MGKFCTNCGQPITEEQETCLNCGKILKVQGNNANAGTTGNPATKSKVVAGVLGILLGSIGVHNFYLGYTGKAVAQLLITVLSCGVLSFVSGVWGLIEGIMILCGSITTDAQGNQLKD